MAVAVGRGTKHSMLIFISQPVFGSDKISAGQTCEMLAATVLLVRCICEYFW